MNIRDLSPPLPSRSRTTRPSLIVLHATAGATARSSIDHLRGVGLSYHYIIPRDGRDTARAENADGTAPIIARCVAEDREAFHVGSTIPTPDGLGINRAAIGVSLANIQRASRPEPYPPAQLQALEELVSDLVARRPSLLRLTVHAVVQPWNRADPLLIDGPAIAARHGLEFWRPTAAQIEEHTPPRP